MTSLLNRFAKDESGATAIESWPDVASVGIGVPGLYNAYNALAAAAVAREVEVSWDVIATAFDAFRSAFGRIERLTYKGRELTLALVKNPTGFNEVLRMLTAGLSMLAAGE